MFSPSITPAAPSAEGHTGSATAREESTLVASGPGSPRSARCSSAPNSPTAHGTSGSHASRVACSWSTRTGRARSPRSPRPSARRSSRRSPSTPPRAATGTTGRATARRSATAAGRLAGHGIDIRGGGGRQRRVRRRPRQRARDRGRLHAGWTRRPRSCPCPAGWPKRCGLRSGRRLQPGLTARRRRTGPCAAWCGRTRRRRLDVDRNDRLFWASCRAAELVATGEVGEATADEAAR